MTKWASCVATCAALTGCTSFASPRDFSQVSGPQASARGMHAQPAETKPGRVSLSSRDARASLYKPAPVNSAATGTEKSEVATGDLVASTGGGQDSAIQQVAYFRDEPEKTTVDTADVPATEKVDKKNDPGISVPEVEANKPGTDKEPKTDKNESLPTTPGTVGTSTLDSGISLESPEGMQGLTLDQAINLCLISDPVIRAGLEAINQSNADALTASLKPNPQLFTDIQLLPLTRPFTPTRQGGPPQYDAIVSYPIDWFLFGKRAAAMQAAGLNVRVSQAEYEDLVRQRVLEAAQAFFGVLEARSLRDVARQDSENFARIEKLTASAVENGGRPQVELNRVRLDRLRSQQFLRDAENILVQAVARMRVVLGRDDDDPAFSVIGSLELAQIIQPLPIDQALEIAEQNRPDLEAARLRIAQADATIEQERRKGFPLVAPGFGYTRQFQEKAIGFPDANSWSAQLTMSLPFFDRNQGNFAKSQSVAAQAGYQLQARRVALRGEVVRATQDLTTAEANTKAVAQEQLQIAKQVRDSINAAYEAGGRPLIDALDAQRNYRETYRLFITSRANYARATVNYSATLGQQITP